MATLDLSLYIHIPFCTKKCDYCDFYSVPVNDAENNSPSQDLGHYIDSVLWETERRFRETAAEYNASIYVPSLYIGGGTPSILGKEGITQLLEGLYTITGRPQEITVEANPTSAVIPFLKACADHGVTRLSLGVQSFNDEVLKAAGRKSRPVHDLSEIAAIFGNGLSLDLMSGLPGQDEAILLNDIEKALSYDPGHISLYALTIEDGTPLALRSKNTSFCPGHQDELWLLGRDALKNAGFEHYEVSNFAKTPSNRSMHNIRYWLMKNWIGIGPAASGTLINAGGAGRRTSYAADVKKFISDAAVIIEELDRATVLKETLLMGFRYCEGPDPALFAGRFGKTIEETIPQTLNKWQQINNNQSMQDTIMNFLNAFLLDAFFELDN